MSLIVTFLSPICSFCVRWMLTKREQNETLWYTPGIPYTPIGILKTL